MRHSNISNFLGVDLSKDDPLENLNKENVRELTKWFYEKFELDGKVQTKLKNKSADLNNLNNIMGHKKAMNAFVDKGYTLEQAVIMTENLE